MFFKGDTSCLCENEDNNGTSILEQLVFEQRVFELQFLVAWLHYVCAELVESNIKDLITSEPPSVKEEQLREQFVVANSLFPPFSPIVLPGRKIRKSGVIPRRESKISSNISYSTSGKSPGNTQKALNIKPIIVRELTQKIKWRHFTGQEKPIWMTVRGEL